MDQFVSAFTNKIDTKGRVSVPASFRTVLTKDSLDGIYCYPSLDAPALDAGGQRLVDKINGLVEGWRPIRTSATNSPPPCSAPARSFLSIKMGAPFCRKGSGSTPASLRTSLLSASARSSRCGSQADLKRIWRKRAKRSAISASYSARGAAEAAGQREHGNDGGSRRGFDRRWRTGPPSPTSTPSASRRAVAWKPWPPRRATSTAGPPACSSSSRTPPPATPPSPN